MIIKANFPPINFQGAKTKLVGWIGSNIENIEYDRWVEPFMGTGVVAFSLKPKTALLCDSNPHVINFYNALKNKEITSDIIKRHLTTEGDKLLKFDEQHYYELRKRFNKEGNPLDFLFLNHSGFNRLMRFSKKNGYNVPYNKKPWRFSKEYVIRILKQVEKISQIIQDGDYTFKLQGFKETLNELKPTDLVYSDPPYIGRHVDYFNSWTEQEEIILKNGLLNSKAKFILSTWLSDKHRINDYIFSVWKDCFITTRTHLYTVGGIDSRKVVYEALLSSIELNHSISNDEMKSRIALNESQLT